MRKSGPVSGLLLIDVQTEGGRIRESRGKGNRGETVFDGLPATKGASADAALSSPSDAYGATSPWRGRIEDVDALPLRSPYYLIFPRQGEVAREA